MTGIRVSASVSAAFVASNFSQLLLSSPNSPLHDSSPGESSTSESEKKKRALVVDDVSDVTEMLSLLLKQAGYEVVTADSAAAALAYARAHQFDFIISDIGMPEMNGYELAKALRVIPGYEAVPMVALTGYSMFNDREKSLQSGFTAHMTKPIEPLSLIHI